MPKIVDHDQYRKELLSKCLTLFAERGYGSVTMRQIGQGLGVSTGTLYHYFPSKESILIQLVEELCEQDIATFFAQAPREVALGRSFTDRHGILSGTFDVFFSNSFCYGLIFISNKSRKSLKIKTSSMIFGNEPMIRWQLICSFLRTKLILCWL